MKIVEYQVRVGSWLLKCFHPKIANDPKERAFRFLEESFELGQSLGVTEEELHKLITYVYGRAIGDPPQEVGGVMVTLSALCLSVYINMQLAAVKELERIERPDIIEKIRAKQISKDLAMITSISNGPQPYDSAEKSKG